MLAMRPSSHHSVIGSWSGRVETLLRNSRYRPRVYLLWARIRRGEKWPV